MVPKLSATKVFDMAMRAQYERGELAEAITYYQAAAQLYLEEGEPKKAQECLKMEQVALEMSDLKIQAVDILPV